MNCLRLIMKSFRNSLLLSGGEASRSTASSLEERSRRVVVRFASLQSGPTRPFSSSSIHSDLGAVLDAGGRPASCDARRGVSGAGGMAVVGGRSLEGVSVRLPGACGRFARLMHCKYVRATSIQCGSAGLQTGLPPHRSPAAARWIEAAPAWSRYRERGLHDDTGDGK